jgi:hypothetical protein
MEELQHIRLVLFFFFMLKLNSENEEERETSPRTQIVNEHQERFLASSISSSEVSSTDTWNAAKGKINQQSQQAIREQRIQKQMDEKKELVATVKIC